MKDRWDGIACPYRISRYHRESVDNRPVETGDV